MSLITVTAAEVAVDEVIEQFTGPCDSQLELGDVVTFDPTSGKLVKADASTDTAVELYGIVVSRQANAYTCVARGVIALGRTAFASLNFGDTLYLSDTAGKIGDAVGTQSVTLGQVIPVWSESPAGRLMRVAPVKSEDVTIDGDLVIDGTLGVTGAATLTGDLAVNGGDLTSSAASFNLLATPTTVTAFAAATTLDLGAGSGTTTVKNDLAVDGTLGVTGAVTLSDDLEINGGDLTTDQTTFNLLDGTVTTLNIGGAATTLDLGADSGTTSVKNSLTVVGAVVMLASLPTSDPSVAGQVWADSSILTLSSG